MKRYENNYFYYVRKPHWVASTFGKESWSFLEQLIQTQSPEIKTLQKEREDGDNQEARKEYGLVNRLDNLTWWLLFFAKDQIIFDNYKALQSQGRVEKIYYADLHWDLSKNHEVIIKEDIYHHYSDDTRMTTDLKLSRWKANPAITHIKPLAFNPVTNTSTCEIIITKWVRHQIRVHAASIGHHIIWDPLYCPKSYNQHYKNTNHIALWSVWLQISL